jgi:hypothetical protein
LNILHRPLQATSHEVRVVQRHLSSARSSVPLAFYTFLGVSLIDPSWYRTVTAFAVSVVLLLWNSRVLASYESEPESWRWSEVTQKSVSIFVLIAFVSVLPFLIRWLWQPPSGKEAWQQGVLFVACLAFSVLVGLTVYLEMLLRPTSGEKVPQFEAVALKLEHQACLTLFQTMGTLMGIIFLGTVLAPTVGAGDKLLSVPVAKLLWAFYCFAGTIIWLLRPCLARAKYIRFRLERLTENRSESGKLP